MRCSIGYKEREIWLCNLGENIGVEEDGKGIGYVRPVLILKIFNKKFCHIIPLSTNGRNSKFFYTFDGDTGRKSTALLSQSRSIDSARLIRKIGVTNKNDFKKIKNKISLIFIVLLHNM
jgi:mRNA-degrading endonuclease toxin of MazEF toxin-antitoxin module